jgi:hypothetical protein
MKHAALFSFAVSFAAAVGCTAPAAQTSVASEADALRPETPDAILGGGDYAERPELAKIRVDLFQRYCFDCHSTNDSSYAMPGFTAKDRRLAIARNATLINRVLDWEGAKTDHDDGKKHLTMPLIDGNGESSMRQDLAANDKAKGDKSDRALMRASIKPFVAAEGSQLDLEAKGFVRRGILKGSASDPNEGTANVALPACEKRMNEDIANLNPSSNGSVSYCMSEAAIDRTNSCSDATIVDKTTFPVEAAYAVVWACERGPIRDDVVQ